MAAVHVDPTPASRLKHERGHASSLKDERGPASRLKYEPASGNTSQQQRKKQQRRYSKSSLHRNWSYIQAHPDKRWLNLLQTRNVLKHYPQQTTFENLHAIMRVRGDLGKGVYGKVYKMAMRSDFANDCPYTFALKLVQVPNADKFDRSSTIEKIMREIQAFGYTNGLVYLRICPNFTLAPRTFFTKVTSNTTSKKTQLCCMIIMERETGTFKEWLVENGAVATVSDIMGHVLQMFMGIAALAKHLEMCHNDLYFKNVLYAKCQPVTLKYNLHGSTFCVRNTSLIIKISDFGIATSPKVLRIGHTELSHLITKNLQLTSFATFDFSNHILDYANIAPYARDSAVVLRSIMKTQHIDIRIRNWAENGLLRLDRCRTNRELVDCDHLLNFILDIFSPSMLIECDLDATMFLDSHEPKSASSAALFGTDATRGLPNFETFSVDGHAIGTDVQVSRMLTNFVAHYHT